MKKIIFCFGLICCILFSNITQAQHKHKKLSDQGRGAIIGGAGGAVAGGLIGHGVGGALVGGAIGAGGGYIIGNEHRKHVEKKKRAHWRAHHTLVRRAKYRYHN